jgi:predicted dehydrogenase
LGKILQVHGVLTNEGPYAGWIPRSDWFFDEKSGGALYDLGSHLFSVLVYVLADRIAEIRAIGANTYQISGVHDQISGHFRTEKGVLGTFNIGWRAATASDSIEIIGSGGSLLVAADRVEERHGSSGYLERVKNHFASAFELISGRLSSLIRREGIDKAFLMEDEGFIRSVTDGQKAIVTGEEAQHVLAVLGAVKESIETGDKVGVKSYP